MFILILLKLFLRKVYGNIDLSGIMVEMGTIVEMIRFG